MVLARLGLVREAVEPLLLGEVRQAVAREQADGRGEAGQVARGQDHWRAPEAVAMPGAGRSTARLLATGDGLLVALR